MGRREAVFILVLGAAGCRADADALGIGAECGAEIPCPDELECVLTDAGGYCVQSGCDVDEDCPSDTACMTHLNHADCVRSCDANYCIRTCIIFHRRPEECSDECPSFEECNLHRSTGAPAQCVATSSSADGKEKKICLPE